LIPDDYVQSGLVTNI